MSTSLLIFLAVLTAVSAVAALAFLRWREQKRLIRARLTIELSDQIMQQLDAASTLLPWLSASCMQYFSELIISNQRRMSEFKLPVGNNVRKAGMQASEWIENPPNNSQAALPQDERQAKTIRKALQQGIEQIKRGYQQHQLDAKKAEQALHELRLLNVRLVVTVLMSKASAAITMNNTSLAESQLNKILKTLAAIKTPTNELSAYQQKATLMLSELAQQTQPTSTEPNRLAEAADLIAEEDQAWKKKHF
ncbi:hypothetical protein [Bacterioplanoides sp.]|uniref:hypothetical protein n=1 Tax=Bacterioplanoides sp. TaxID=2066072 RepID=UPI003AFF758F